MINYPAVSADWQTLTGSRPTMCLPQVCCITDSSRPSLDPTIISPAALSNPLGDGCCCSSSFLHLPNSSQPQGPLSLRFSRSLSESHSVGCENHRLAPPTRLPEASSCGPAPPTRRRRRKQQHAQTCHESTYVVYTGNQTSGRKGAHGRFFPPTSSRLFLNKHSCRGRCAAGDAKNASGLNVCRVNHSNCHRNDFCNVHFCGVNLDGVVMLQ